MDGTPASLALVVGPFHSPLLLSNFLSAPVRNRRAEALYGSLTQSSSLFVPRTHSFRLEVVFFVAFL